MDITKVVLSELKEIKLRLQHKIKKMKFEFDALLILGYKVSIS